MSHRNFRAEVRRKKSDICDHVLKDGGQLKDHVTVVMAERMTTGKK